jgi:hypothetical protein
MESLEQTGEKFNLDTYLSARQLCKSVVRKIATLVEPGISETIGQQFIKEEFAKVGVSKFWHPSKFRIGPETMKSFREIPNETIRLGKGDVFFLDVGPIIDDHEADYGETFISATMGSSNEELKKLSEASIKIWNETASRWKNEKLSGVALFNFADQLAKSYEYQLNPLMAGHRLGDFPHALFSKEKLFSLDFVPRENLWVLEIHLVDTKLQRGAFFEDVLL